LPPDDVARAFLERAKASRDDLEARLLLAAAIQRVADRLGLLAIVTGGTAVDFYAAGAAGTSAAYPARWRASADVDVVAFAVSASSGTVRALQERLARELDAGIERLGEDADGRTMLSRGLTFPGLGYAAEIVGEALSLDPRAERVFRVDVAMRAPLAATQTVILRGPEDTLLAYAESGWDLRDARDWERALAVAAAMKEEIDLDYVRAKARERGFPRVAEEALAGRALPGEREPLS